MLLTLTGVILGQDEGMRVRDLGVELGIFRPGAFNAITDVSGVQVGHTTLIVGDSIRTGVTAIMPHAGNMFLEKVPAAIYVANGYGKLAGSTQLEELGNIEVPIILTNTLSVAAGIEGVVRYTITRPGSEQVRSVNAVVGETNDGFLNDIRGMHVTPQHVIDAILNSKSGPVEEGNVGAGTGTRCFGYKGGIGTASRELPKSLGGYTLGVLVQTNFGGILQFAGVPVGKLWDKYPYRRELEEDDGSCMIVVATDAPLSSRNLRRLAKRAFLGLGKTGGYASNGSGDYVIAFSTNSSNRIRYQDTRGTVDKVDLNNDNTSPLFQAAVEATEEAILNSLLQAETMSGHRGTIEAIDREALRKLLDATIANKR